MGAYVLLNLLNEFGKGDKMRGFSATSLINSILQKQECYSIYHTTLKLLINAFLI